MEKGPELARKAGNKKYISRFFGKMGVVFQSPGQYDNAKMQSLAIHKENGEGNDLNNKTRLCSGHIL